jgi:hypothetical protein
MHLQLAVTVRMLLGVRMLLLQSLQRGTHIVAVFFQRSVYHIVVAFFFRAARFRELRITELFQ